MSDNYNIFTIINSLSYTKDRSVLEHEKFDSVYSQFIINKAFSNFADTVLWANEMNRTPMLTNRQHFEFLFNAIPRRKRFGKWAKKINDPVIDLVCDFYNISRQKAMEIIDIVDIDYIKKKSERGGRIK